MTAQLTIQIVGWNSSSVLAQTLPALHVVPLADVIIRYIDNHSTDDSIATVRKLLPRAQVVALPRNLGFAQGHNEGFIRCTTPYVLTCDPDVTLHWPGVQVLIQALEGDPTLGAVQGKLLRQEIINNKSMIDSAGIVLTYALNGKERGAFEEDKGQFATRATITATTGACSLYRLQALKQVAHGRNEFYDRDFFAYKEDVDLGWRLQRAGWKVHYVPVLIGHHARTLGRRGIFNWGSRPRLIYRRLQSPRTRYSLRNWIWMIAKNATPMTIFQYSPAIIGRGLVFLGLSLLYPSLFKIWPEVISGLPRMNRKRREGVLKQI
ncbi:MAG: glycosyltransferase [Candidatus Andersenbacteria bacterium]